MQPLEDGSSRERIGNYVGSESGTPRLLRLLAPRRYERKVWARSTTGAPIPLRALFRGVELREHFSRRLRSSAGRLSCRPAQWKSPLSGVWKRCSVVGADNEWVRNQRYSRKSR